MPRHFDCSVILNMDLRSIHQRLKRLHITATHLNERPCCHPSTGSERWGSSLPPLAHGLYKKTIKTDISSAAIALIASASNKSTHLRPHCSKGIPVRVLPRTTSPVMHLTSESQGVLDMVATKTDTCTAPHLSAGS